MEKFIKYEIKPNIKTLNENYGQFEIGPLESGFGITIGNALRRVILSSIPGATIFAIKIPEIQHEFSAIDGIKEDVTQIILNLKQLALQIDESAIPPDCPIEKWPIMKIMIKDSGVIKASNIELPAGFNIVNKDLYIATKTSNKSPFVMEIYAKNGRGFVNFKQNHEMINTLNIIATDSNFSPILQVGYLVEEKKITKNKMGDFVKLDIATNGAISPTNALAYAAKILTDHFDQITSINEKIKEIKMINEEEAIKKVRHLSISIDELDLSVRSYNCLKKNGIRTLQELTNKTKEEVQKFENLGKKSFREIQKKMMDNGLTFKPSSFIADNPKEEK